MLRGREASGTRWSPRSATPLVSEMRNINHTLLSLIQQISMRQASTEAEQAFADVNRQILTAVADLFPDGLDGVSIEAFRQVRDACRHGIDTAGDDSLDARDYREVLSALSDMTQAHGRDRI